MNQKTRKFMSAFLSASSVAAFGAGALALSGSAFAGPSPDYNPPVRPPICTGCKPYNAATNPTACGKGAPPCVGGCFGAGKKATSKCDASCGCNPTATKAACSCWNT
jgi:hypothetical protein